MDKPDLMTDALGLAEVKVQKRKTKVFVEDGVTKTSMTSSENLLGQLSQRVAPSAKRDQITRPDKVSSAVQHPAKPMAPVSTNTKQERKKQKPRKIMVEYRDPVTGERTKTIVDKVIKKRITPLKKAIMKKREFERDARLLRKEERKKIREALALQKSELLKNGAILEAENQEEEGDDGYVTVDETKSDQGDKSTCEG